MEDASLKPESDALRRETAGSSKPVGWFFLLAGGPFTVLFLCWFYALHEKLTLWHGMEATVVKWTPYMPTDRHEMVAVDSSLTVTSWGSAAKGVEWYGDAIVVLSERDTLKLRTPSYYRKKPIGKDKFKVYLNPKSPHDHFEFNFISDVVLFGAFLAGSALLLSIGVRMVFFPAGR